MLTGTIKCISMESYNRDSDSNGNLRNRNRCIGHCVWNHARTHSHQYILLINLNARSIRPALLFCTCYFTFFCSSSISLSVCVPLNCHQTPITSLTTLIRATFYAFICFIFMLVWCLLLTLSTAISAFKSILAFFTFINLNIIWRIVFISSIYSMKSATAYFAKLKRKKLRYAEADANVN